ncbi:type II toxin-antitoxin system VapB family antitoxin [Streptomyces sp. NPDC095613]|uniref:type II toxin-antitoxin system VapB family antitoxin n=1 Tax=Streptomyces sp. NPDC095613 TaxID=3155540 RepID=UPI00332AD7FF
MSADTPPIGPYDEALVEAMRLMSASIKKETVNTALRAYVARVRRLEAAAKLASRGERGEFDAAAAAHEAGKRARRTALE